MDEKKKPAAKRKTVSTGACGARKSTVPLPYLNNGLIAPQLLLMSETRVTVLDRLAHMLMAHWKCRVERKSDTSDLFPWLGAPSKQNSSKSKTAASQVADPSTLEETREVLHWDVVAPDHRRVTVYLLSKLTDAYHASIRVSPNEDALVVYDVITSKTRVKQVHTVSTLTLMANLDQQHYLLQLKDKHEPAYGPQEMDAKLKERRCKSTAQLPQLSSTDAFLAYFYGPYRTPGMITFWRTSQTAGESPYTRLVVNIHK